MTASGHADLPGGQGNAYADGATGSSQQTATGHVETESFHAASSSGQKTATAPGVSGHEKSATRTMTGVDALDLLTANGKRSESENYSDVHESYSFVTWPSYPSLILDPKIGTQEDNTWWQDSEVSLEFSRRGTCGENWGETSKSEAREMGVCSEQASPTSPAPEGGGEAGARPQAPDESLEALPPLSLDLDQARGEEAPPRHNTRCTLRPLLLPLPS